LVGWLIFTGLFGIGDTDVFDLGGIIGAIIGSILVLVGVGWFLRRTGRRPAS
jgi:high-affinity Fe2+/Pb2+ permease